MSSAVQHASADFETYSEAGYIWNGETWERPEGSDKYGLQAVGLAVYAEHPSTEVISLSYNLKDGKGKRLWLPGTPPPLDLFDYLARGGIVEAWNAGFELAIWFHVCVKQLGWPVWPVAQAICAQARAQAYSLPGSLAKAGAVVRAKIQKDGDGDRLIKLFSMPRQPTQKDRRTRIRPQDDLINAQKFYDYNGIDIDAEDSTGECMPHLIPEEQAFWESTMRMNLRGVAIDVEAVRACIRLLKVAYARAEAEVAHITGGAVTTLSQVARIQTWLATYGVRMNSLDADARAEALDPKGPVLATLLPACRRVIELKDEVGSAGVKKVYSMSRMVDGRGRLCHLFRYHGARTGRDTGEDAQPQNLVKRGPKLLWCEDTLCLKPYGGHLYACPHCGTPALMAHADEWSWKAVETALTMIHRGYDAVQQTFGNPVLLVSGCIRGLFTAGRGMRLVCSDFSSIEAVVTACLAGEQWRIDAFHRRDDIYLTSAGKIKGHTLEWYMANGGKKHPDRQKVGKPAELGLGFGGWIGAWRQFDDSDTFTDEEVKANINAWRRESPMVVELWGGQIRGKPWNPSSYELYGLEGAIIRAIQAPGTWQTYRLLSYYCCPVVDVMYLQLPSGRRLAYHRPRLRNHPDQKKRPGQLEISYETYNTNSKMGPIGWIRRTLYGGSAAENGIQAVARDIMRDAVLRLEPAGYNMVLRSHDELVAEVPEDFGSVEEFEALMSKREGYYSDWPIWVSGGYAAKRYRKD